MRDTDTLAWRLKLEREQRGWSQEYVAELLRGYGVEVVKQAISKIETGATQTPSWQLVAALAKLYETSIDYLVTGIHPRNGHDVFMTPEANEVGQVVDQLPEILRKVMLQGAQILLNMHQEHERLQRETHQQNLEIAELLEENINFLADRHRRIARGYIDRTRRHNSA